MNSERLKRADDRINEAVYNQSIGAAPPPAAEEEGDNHMTDANGGNNGDDAAQDNPNPTLVNSPRPPTAQLRKRYRNPIAHSEGATRTQS